MIKMSKNEEVYPILNLNKIFHFLDENFCRGVVAFIKIYTFLLKVVFQDKTASKVIKIAAHPTLQPSAFNQSE